MRRDFLQIGSKRNLPINQYRVVGNQVQFRVGNPREAEANWRVLTNDEILMHLSLDTAVAEWLIKRLHISAAIRTTYAARAS